MQSKVSQVVGVLIIVFGVILMLGVFGIIDSGSILATFWPVILMIFGIYTIIDKKSSAFFGVLLLLVGIYLQLRELDFAILNNVDLSQLIWPIIIIVIGLRILIPTKK